MPSSVAPVLVAGGGPTGLVAALTLLQNDVPVRIIAKELEHHVGQRGSGLWPRTFEALHLLRVFEPHRMARGVLPIREYTPGSLKIRRTFPIVAQSDSTPSIPYNNMMFLGQPLLEGILRAHLATYGCAVELGTELQSFEDDGERVLATLVKRKNGEEFFETFEASYLIGADGAKGVTRKQLGLTFLGESRKDFLCVVGDLCLEIPGVDREHWNFFGDSTSDFFMLRPTDEIAPDGFYFLLTTTRYSPAQLIEDETSMIQCMSEITGYDIQVRKIVVLTEYRPNFRMVDKFGCGRVFVAGDAAHIHSPTGAQGLNSSVQDAINLAWKLSLVHKGLSPATLLDSYTAERLPVIAEMLDITTGILNKIRSTQIEKFDPRLNMLGVNYRSSPIVLDAFAQPGAKPTSAYGVLDEGLLVAGDRAPGATELALVSTETETRTTLFDVFSAICHTVLMFVPDVGSSTDVLGALKGYPGDVLRLVIVLPQGSEVTTRAADVVAVLDCGGHTYRAYLAVEGEKKVVVVRPDGVVGAIVRDGEGVGAYFSRIFG